MTSWLEPTAVRLAPAAFRGTAALNRFHRLQTAPADQFLAVAQDLADRLHLAMDNRSKRGFAVALRRELPDAPPQVAFPKLDVSDEPAAAARGADTGVLRLEAVRDLLDLPGDLQKGAVYPDSRPNSEVVVGDKVMAETAQYFLRCIEVQQYAGDQSAATTFVSVVRTVAPDKVDSVALELDRGTREMTPDEFFQAHPDLLADLEVRQVIERLSDQPRPVRSMNPTARPLRKVVTADGIVVRSRVQDVERKVRWQPVGGRWQITITVSTEPRTRYE